MNTTNASIFSFSAHAPVTMTGTISANIIWNEANKGPGILGATARHSCPKCNQYGERKGQICDLCMGSAIWAPDALVEKHFSYQSDFDRNGVIYYIGSNDGKKKWANPAADRVGGMTCTRGSFALGDMSISNDGEGSANDLLSREPNDSWVTVAIHIKSTMTTLFVPQTRDHSEA